jgi:hypothetical protein
MARIQYCAPSPKAGQIEHVSTTVASTLIASGFAVAVPYKNYQERLQAEAQTGSDPSNVNPAWVATPTWSISTAKRRDAKPIILFSYGSEQTRFEDAAQAEANGCPAVTLKYFNQLLAADDDVARANVLDAARAAQTANEVAEKKGVWRFLGARA